MSKLNELASLGQSIWYDYIRRQFVKGGELQLLINKGLRGVTSNPSIFEKAIAGSNDYNEDLKELIKQDLTIEEMYEKLALIDIDHYDCEKIVKTLLVDRLLPLLDGVKSTAVSIHLISALRSPNCRPTGSQLSARSNGNCS